MERVKIKKVPELTYRLIPVRGSEIPEWPNDVKEIEVDDGVVYDVFDWYRIKRDEDIYPEGLIVQAFGKPISQVDIWQMYRRENSIYFFIAKLRE